MVGKKKSSSRIREQQAKPSVVETQAQAQIQAQTQDVTDARPPEADGMAAEQSNANINGGVNGDAQKTSPEEDPEISGDGTEVINSDGYLEQHREYFKQRYAHFKRWVKVIDENEGGIDKFSQGYKEFGLHVTAEGVRYREWAPGAREASLVGDFNGWDVNANPMERNEYG
ncbi:alpha-1,4-glucan branching enzyme, partial [Coemansia sp. RSA 2049]